MGRRADTDVFFSYPTLQETSNLHICLNLCNHTLTINYPSTLLTRTPEKFAAGRCVQQLHVNYTSVARMKSAVTATDSTTHYCTTLPRSLITIVLLS